ncbi:MAG: HAD-IIB family hydrolase [Proteobacteria bacterium]|nr:MAG: HAD-IIB family hydrolase [Pseudomonadota bacterium]
MRADTAEPMPRRDACVSIQPDIAALLLCEGSPVRPKWIVFSDVDGTLIDYHTYEPGPALPVLQRLEGLGVPVVFTTSKTRAEVESLRHSLGIDTPFIVENGAAIFVPESQFDDVPEHWERRQGYRALTLSMPYGELRAVLGSLRARFRFESLSDMSVARLVNLTGLAERDAANALRREFGEPVLWRDSVDALSRFTSELAARDLAVDSGGRFLHVRAANADKGSALKLLCAEYQNLWRSVTRVIALGDGDGDNDSSMLAAADLAVTIPSPSPDSPSIGETPRIAADREGPEGWSRVMTALADLYEASVARG